MTDHSGDQPPLSKQERQRMLEQVREMLGEALVAHELSDAESVEAMNNIVLDDIIEDHQKRIDKLWHDDVLGMVAFGDDPGWIEKRLSDDG